VSLSLKTTILTRKGLTREIRNVASLVPR
jgi:hypothetical protein